jgi:CubicO group peptidase (beta-lactamase class C family)
MGPFLTDPLALYAQGAPVPSFGERQITLLDLATHSAGLPRDAPHDPVRPGFTWPTPAELWDWFSKYRLRGCGCTQQFPTHAEALNFSQAKYLQDNLTLDAGFPA